MLCAMAIGVAAPATAADWKQLSEPVLRGSETIEPPRYKPGYPVHFRWEGLYLGGQIGRTESGADFSTGVSSLVSYILRHDVVGNHVVDWTTLPKDSTVVGSWGGFLGYNLQWDEAVIGFELNYNRIKVDHAVADSLTRSFNDDAVAPAGHHFFYTATVAGSASVAVTDYGTVRARAAWAYGRLLPYIFGGLAIGRGTVTHSATVSYTRTDTPDATTPPTPPITPIPTFNFGPVTRSETLSNRVFYGYTAGLGIDIAVLPNVFVRGEWEYIEFTTLPDVKLHFNTLRAGLGIKF
jgi:opacity protein-like surface antigen